MNTQQVLKCAYKLVMVIVKLRIYTFVNYSPSTMCYVYAESAGVTVCQNINKTRGKLMSGY